MKQNLHVTLTLLYGVSLTGLLAGCSMPTKEDIAKNTTEYNLVAEKAGNEMLLLNIVRASKRRPMYFTSFGKLTGQMSFEVGTGSITIPFGSIGDGLNGSNSIAPSASYINSPLFDVAVLDTKEFTNGIMTPVPMKTIEYYWSQGWPPEMLLHLFIRRIEITDRNGKVLEEYDNYPGDPCKFKCFQEQLRTKNWNIKEKEVKDTSIGEVDATEVSKLKNLIKAQKAGLKLGALKKNDKVDLFLSQVKYEFVRDEQGKEGIETSAFISHDSYQGDIDDKSRRKVYIRSPEAILYYLGEIMRSENNTEDLDDPSIPKIDVSHKRSGTSLVPLFYARKATNKDKAPCVSVNYEGTEYIIPGDPDGKGKDRSMHVLSLVSQLIGLQKKITETPTTTTVSVIGR